MQDHRPAVLLVEDEPSVADALKLILEDQGFEVAWARTGAEGVSRSLREHFVLVITDFRLPDINGLEVLRAVRAACPSTALVLITSYAAGELLCEALACGAAAALTKPFSPDAMVRLVNCVLEGGAAA